MIITTKWLSFNINNLIKKMNWKIIKIVIIKKDQ